MLGPRNKVGAQLHDNLGLASIFQKIFCAHIGNYTHCLKYFKLVLFTEFSRENVPTPLLPSELHVGVHGTHTRKVSSYAVNRLIKWLFDVMNEYLTKTLLDWLNYSLTDSITHWLTQLLIDWLNDSLDDSMTHWLTQWLIDWINASLTDSMTH